MSIDQIISDVRTGIEAETAAQLLRRGMTLGGRVEWDDAVAALSSAERHACDRVMAQKRFPSARAGTLSIAFRPHGRLYLLPREEFEAQAQALALLCNVDLDPDDLKTYQALRHSTRQALEQDRAEICGDLNEQGFDRVCAELAAVAEHMAPLVCYVGERCISNFYNVGKSGFAPEMTIADVLRQVSACREQADIELLTAVHCLHLVLRSGSYTRLEELNSTQLSRRAVLEFFDAKCAFYQKACGLTVSERFESAGLREKATMLAGMRETIAMRQRFIRLISGHQFAQERSSFASSSGIGVRTSTAPLSPSANVLAILQRFLPSGTSMPRICLALNISAACWDLLCFRTSIARCSAPAWNI